MAGPTKGPIDALSEAYEIAFDALRNRGADVTGPSYITAELSDPTAADLLGSVRGDVDNIAAADAVVAMPGVAPASTDVTLAKALAVPVVDLEDVAPEAAHRLRWLMGALVAMVVAAVAVAGLNQIWNAAAPHSQPKIEAQPHPPRSTHTAEPAAPETPPPPRKRKHTPQPTRTVSPPKRERKVSPPRPKRKPKRKPRRNHHHHTGPRRHAEPPVAPPVPQPTDNTTPLLPELWVPIDPVADPPLLVRLRPPVLPPLVLPPLLPTTELPATELPTVGGDEPGLEPLIKVPDPAP